jgi:hypothetical protein
MSFKRMLRKFYSKVKDKHFYPEWDHSIGKYWHYTCLNSEFEKNYTDSKS